MTQFTPREKATEVRRLISTVGGRRSIALLGCLFIVLAGALAYVLASGKSPVFDIFIAFSLSAGPGAILIYRSYQLPDADIDPHFYPVIGVWCFGSTIVAAATLAVYHVQPAAGYLTQPTRIILNIASLSGIAGYAIGFHDARARTRASKLEQRNEELQQAREKLEESNEQLEQRNRELQQVKEELEESNERLEQFAYTASHDLQEPLRMVSSYVQLLEDQYVEDLDENAEEYIGFAVDGADRMRTMIEGLLAYSRVDTEANPLEPTDSETAVQNALKNLEKQIEDSDAEIDVKSLPTVHADGNQLEQVFQNLISNAIKYNGDGPPEIEISAERAGEEWVFQVADNGIGMDPDQINRIYDVFERLHTTEEYSGTGIGLALCQKIIERHEGDLWVESEPGDGSTFYFTIPNSDHSRELGDQSGAETTIAE